VDPAHDIAEFLTTRRAKVTPEQAGLPTYGPRRVKGLRREEVARRLSADDGLTIAVFTPEPGSASEQALDLLGSWTATSHGAGDAAAVSGETREP
jgi:hypothetical protein